MNNCTACNKIKKMADEKGGTILIAAGGGMVIGLVVGMIVKACEDKGQATCKKLCSLGLSALSDLISEISDIV